MTRWFYLRAQQRAQLAALLLVLLAGCGESDSDAEVAAFCAALAEVNSGAVDTEGLAELQGHALVAQTLLAAAPPSLVDDLGRIHFVDGCTYIQA